MASEPNDIEARTRAAAGGDRQALESLLVDYLPEVRAFVRARLGPAFRERESSCDVAQSVCREILTKADRFQHTDGQSFRRWLFTSALRKIRDRRDYHLAQRRDRGREAVFDDPQVERSLLEAYSGVLTPSRAVAAREHLQRVERAMDGLTSEQREVLTLSRIVGLPFAAIAEETGKSEGAVRMILHRALARLVAIVDAEGGI